MDLPHSITTWAILPAAEEAVVKRTETMFPWTTTTTTTTTPTTTKRVVRSTPGPAAATRRHVIIAYPFIRCILANRMSCPMYWDKPSDLPMSNMSPLPHVPRMHERRPCTIVPPRMEVDPVDRLLRCCVDRPVDHNFCRHLVARDRHWLNRPWHLLDMPRLDARKPSDSLRRWWHRHTDMVPHRQQRLSPNNPSISIRPMVWSW